MRVDRAEIAGTGAAVVFHIALIAALTLSLADVDVTPEPPSMEVEFIEDVGLEAAAPTSIATPPPVAQAPEIGEAQLDEAVPPPPAPAPTPTPRPQPRVAPTPPRPAPVARPRPTQTRPAPKVSRIGDDFLKGIQDDDLAPRNSPARPSAPVYNAAARTNIATSIARQAQRCADRQPFLGDGADQIQVNLRLSFARSGRLSRPPAIVSMSGPSDLRAQYGDQLEDQVRRIFADCSPFRLPADLYDTDDGGWKETTLRYRVKK